MTNRKPVAKGPEDGRQDRRPPALDFFGGLLVLTVLAGVLIMRGGRLAPSMAGVPDLQPQAVWTATPMDSGREEPPGGAAPEPQDVSEIIAIGPVT